jgi:nitronate monooxygenase
VIVSTTLASASVRAPVDHERDTLASSTAADASIPAPPVPPRLGDRRFVLGGRAYVPLVIGGMGVGISTPALALEAVRLGGIGHLSDAMMPAVVDGEQGTHFVRDKLKRYKHNVGSRDKSGIHFDLELVAQATRLHVSKAVAAKQGPGALFLNCMEKLTMGNARGTLKARLEAAMDAEIDGITLSAGLHLSTLSLIKDHPRFHDVQLGVIVSSVRALKLFLTRAARTGRQPDYIVVEGPLAGGHLGFGEDWADYDLAVIVQEVVSYLNERELSIAVIAAGGVFTGEDALEMLSLGCSAVQVATRFAITRESGLPESAKWAYVEATPDDVVVNALSPTGYPMRMLRSSPALHSRVRPNCEAYGYLLDNAGGCAYRDAWYEDASANAGISERACLCTEMRRFRVWTCGHTVSRLKNTLPIDSSGRRLPSAEEVFNDYLWGSAQGTSA